MGKKSDHINLDQIGREYPFHTPEGYFDQFSEKMMKLIEIENKPTRNVFFIRYLKPAFGLVASFLIIMGLLYVPTKLIFHGKTNPTQKTSMLDDKYYISYLLSDHNIFETLETSLPDDTYDNEQLETILLASVSEYDLINLKN